MTKSSKLLKIVAYIIFGWLVFTFVRNSYLLWKAGDRLDEARSQLQNKEKENQNLQSLLYQVDSSQFVEKEARDKLGLARPGEVVFILPPEEELRKLAPDFSVKPEVSLPNWRQWLNLFL